MDTLARTLKQIRSRITSAGVRGLNEENTKATLIEPLLRALGWNVEDVEEVQREFKVKKSDKPVDYGLLVLRNLRLFLEAKALGADLADRRWANQIMGYAGVAGAEWIVLTNGEEYRIYNTHAPVSVEEKLFRTVKVTDDSPVVAQTLELLSRERMAENRIEVLWRAQFVDRQVKAAVEALFSGESDLVLVNHVLSHTKNLSAPEVRASLERCRMQLDFPIKDEELLVPVPSPKPHDGVSLLDLIQAGLLRAPARLVREYKGKTLHAVIEHDGRVRFADEHFDSISQAGGAARATVIGRKAGKVPATNGWTFWNIVLPNDQSQLIDNCRQEFIRMQEGGNTDRAIARKRAERA
jgi:predicted type IV restriction endonuclease